MSNARVLVRTWFNTPKGTEHLLKSVNYPLSVLLRIRGWAVDNQFNLLHRKYVDIPEKKSSAHSAAAFAASNQLWKELQQEGYTSEDDRHAITFLFGLHEDNPELIDWEVTQEFLSSLGS